MCKENVKNWKVARFWLQAALLRLFLHGQFSNKITKVIFDAHEHLTFFSYSEVMQPLVQQPILPVVKQSVKERLGPVPTSTIEPTEAQSASADLPQVSEKPFYCVCCIVCSE